MMHQQTKTYRLIVTLTAILFMAGAGMPTGLFAKHLSADQCDTAQETTAQPVSEKKHTPAEHADHQSNSAERADCDVGLICECCSNHSIPKIQSANTFTRIKADQSVFADDIIDRKQFSIASVPTFYLQLTSEADEASPPLFLKYSVFLN